MAYNTNYRFWMTTNNELKDLLLRQYAVRKLKITTRLPVHDILAELYARYVVIVNKLGYLFDQTLQVQKRALIRKLLEAATRRLFELRNELKKLELSEFIYIDKTLVQRKLIPQDVQLMRPFYFPYMRSEEIDKIINGPRIEEKLPFDEVDADLISSRGSVVSTIEKPATKKKKKFRPIIEAEKTVQLTPEEQARKDAIIKIQAHERARQSRVWLTNIKTNPEKYAPKMPEITDKYKYEFMHKPTQTMLIPVRRTKFEANYYIDAKEQKKFEYYSKPSTETKKIPSETFTERTEEEAVAVKISTDSFHDQPSICMEFMNTRRKPFNLLSDYDSIHAENYFLEGMLKHECGVEFKTTLSKDSIPEPATSLSASQRIKEYNAACLIQRVWKGYKTRRYVREKALQRQILYGMYDERKWRVDINKDLKEYQRQRRLRKATFDQAFIQACEDEKARILKVRSPWIMEDISDSIRAWFREFYDNAKEFDEYPKELKGGTVLVVKGETLTVPEFIKKKSEKKKTKEQKKKEAEKRKAELAKEKEKAKKAKIQAQRKAEQIRRAGGIAIDFASMTDNPNVKGIEKTLLEYDVEWQHIDEANNIQEDPYMHWITMEKFDEVYKELRITVDEFMRNEYILLQMALAKDRKKKYKPKKEKKKGKDKKKNKGKKGKKVKDITADRTTASLYYEMVDSGLIKKYPKRDFDEFIGDYNFCAYEIRNFLDMDTPPSKGELKDILRECIVGMGPLDISKPKSILLAGPVNSGKTLLVEIIATEIDAMMIDLSPEVVVKFADRMPYLIHLVTKMAKLLEPTIISIEGVHRTFWKKIPKDQMYLNPRLLSKYLQKKIIKPIKKEDKIMVVGTTEAPFQANAKMKKSFEKIILLPNTDYGTAFLLWRSKTLSMLGIPRDFDFSPLAKVTKAYATGDICKDIEETLNIQRRLKLTRKPLTHMEFLDYFLNRPEPYFPPQEEEYGKFLKWFTKIDKLTKQRAKYLKEVQEAKEKAKKKNEKKGGK